MITDDEKRKARNKMLKWLDDKIKVIEFFKSSYNIAQLLEKNRPIVEEMISTLTEREKTEIIKSLDSICKLLKHLEY
ncbi:hypothetical protein ES702_04094 [subsurface metagenome]